MKYPTYSAKKNSGIDWLSDIPIHWEVKRLGFLLARIDGGVWGNDSDSESDTIVLRSTEQNIDGTWKLEDPARRKLTEQEKLSALLDEGDLVVTKSSGSAQHIGKTSYVTREIASMNCCFSNFMQRLRPKTKNHSRFLFFVLNNPIAREQFNYFSNSTTGLANLNASVIGQVRVAVPPEDEIEHLLHFLDIETSQTDTLIAKQERLIALLQEKRQSLISHAVTKGLNPDVPMKDSGIEWLGEVPEHWQVLKLKRIASLKSGSGINSDLIEPEGDYSVFGGNGIRGYTDKYSHEGHYALIGRQGALCGNVNYAEGRFWASEHAVVVSPLKDLSIKWLGEMLRAMNLNQYSISAAQPGLSVEAVSNLFVPCPSLPEQQAIATFLNQETHKIDKLTDKAQNAITILKERRTALISAAVTGKIDVRAYMNGNPL